MNILNFRILIFLFMLAAFFGCSKERTYKADDIIGYWEGSHTSEISVNESQPSTFQKNFYVRFLDTNCGFLYDQNENWTNDIKWALQERGGEDILIVSTVLNSNGQSSDFSVNTVNYVEEFEEMNFKTISTQIDTLDEGVKVTNTSTQYKRQ